MEQRRDVTAIMNRTDALIKKFKKETKTQQKNLKLLETFFVLFLKEGVESYIINLYQKIINLDCKSTERLSGLLGNYVFDLTLKKREFARSRYIIKKWEKLNIKDKQSKKISWNYKRETLRKILLTIHWNEFRLYFKEKNFREAMDSLLYFIKIDATNPVAYFLLGLTYETMGKEEDSVRAYEKCNNLAPLHPMVFWRIGLSYLRQKQFKVASVNFQKTIEVYNTLKKERPYPLDEFTAKFSEDNEHMRTTYVQSEVLEKYSEGLLNLSIGNFREAKNQFIKMKKIISSRRLIPSYPIKILPKIAEIDEMISQLGECHDFSKLREETTRLTRKVFTLITPEIAKSPFYNFILCKFHYLLFLLDSLNTEVRKELMEFVGKSFHGEKVEDLEREIFTLEGAINFLESEKQMKFLQFINSLKTFSLEVKQFSNISSVPLDRQRILIKSLIPFFNIMDGQLTIEVIAKDVKDLLSGQIDIKDLVESLLKSKKEEKTETESEKLEYEEEIDLNDKDYKYNLLSLEIDYINDEFKVTLKLLDREKEPTGIEEEIEEFIKSERDLAFLFRLAVAIMVNEDSNEGWLHKYNKLFFKSEEGKPKRDTELGDFRKLLADCSIPFLEEIAKSKRLDAKKVKKSLLCTKEYPPSVRLAIPRITIRKETIENIRNYKCRFISPKRLIRLPKYTIVKVRDLKEKLEESEKNKLEKIPVIEVVEALIREACNVYINSHKTKSR